MSDEFKNLENLENKLNKPKGFNLDTDTHSLRDKKNEKDVKFSWGKDGPIITPIHVERNSVSFGVKLFFVSVLLLVVSLSYTAYRVSSERNTVSAANIDIALDLKPYVEGGENVPLLIEIKNRNLLPLYNASLVITYKKGLSSQNESEEIREKIDLGAIQKGESKTQEKSVQFFGSEAEAKDVDIKLEYKVAGSNAVFSKTAKAQTIIKTPSVSVRLDGPSSLYQGQSGTYTVNIKNNTSITTTPFVAVISFPESFNIDSAEPKLSSKETFWSFEGLKTGESKQIKVTGYFSSNNSKEKRTIHATVGVSQNNSKNISTVYSSDMKDISLSTSPIKLTLTGGDGISSGYLKYGDRTSFILTYKNESNSVLRNVELNVHVSGSAPVINSVSDDDTGYYDSIKQIITWRKETLPTLGTLQPGADGSVRFYVPIVSKGVNLPDLRIGVTSFADLNTERDTTSSISGTWIVKGSISLNAATTYKSSPFTNTGPVPPKANTETTYTLKLSASTQNKLEDAKVSFRLPIYVNWKNIYTEGKDIVYDEKLKTVTWNIKDMSTGQTENADILLSVTPSQTHVGKSPAITSGIVFEGTETDSNSVIKTSISSPTTALFEEGWNINTGNVIDR